MRLRRCAFVPQLDRLSYRIVPSGGAADMGPAIAPDDNDDGSDDTTDPGYGDVDTESAQTSDNGGSGDSGDGSDPGDGSDSGDGSDPGDGSAADGAIDGLYGDGDPLAPQFPDGSDDTSASPVNSVDPYS